MLEPRPNCEYFGKDLLPECKDVLICTFECTFCSACAESVLKYQYPNYRGNLVERPVRPAGLLNKYPASTNRIVKEEGCIGNA